MPERSHPLEGEVSSSDLIFHHVQQGRRPTIIPNMLNGLDDDVKEDWLSTINRCLDQDPEKRPPIATVTRVLENMTTKENDQLTSSSKVNELVLEGLNVENIPLNVHQGTVVESAGDIAVSLFEHGEVTERVQEELEARVRRLDGTNACIFLAVKNVDNILSNSSTVDATTKLTEQVETLCRNFQSRLTISEILINTITSRKLFSSFEKEI